MNPVAAPDRAEIYGEGFAAVYTTSRYTSFSRRLAKLALACIERHGAPGRALLDLACGAGVGSALLAEAGYDVTGVDASEVMLGAAAGLARDRGLTLRLHRQDLRAFALPGAVDVVTCLFDALNYLLSEDELAECFAAVARALCAGGLFVFDMNTPHGLATRWGTKDAVSTARADLFEVNQNRYDADTHINTTTTTVFVHDSKAGDGEARFRRYTEVHRERGYTLETVLALLARAGLAPLSVEQLADGFQGLTQGLSPVTDEAGRVVICARRIVSA